MKAASTQPTPRAKTSTKEWGAGVNDHSPTAPSAGEQSAYQVVLADPRFQLALVVLIAAVLMFSKLGGNGLANYDDCFYAEKAKEVLQTGEWMTMHYNHVPAFENTPFYIWLIALMYKIIGVSEYSAKFPSAFFGVATVALVYFFARYLINAWMGFFSSLVLSTTFIFTRYARHAMFDVTLTFFVTLAIFALVLAVRRDPRYYLLWGLSIAVCVLTKSVLGFFPLVISVLFLILTKRREVFLQSYFLIGCIVALLVGGSWWIHEYAKFGQGFLDAHFGWLVLQRGFSLEPGPWYEHLSYFKDLLTNYWPWLPVFILGVVRMFRLLREKNEVALLLVLWFFVIILTMSVMNARVLWYIMPVFPAAAMVSAYVLHGFFNDKGKRIVVQCCVGLCLAIQVVVNMTPLEVEPQRERDVRVLAPYVKHFAAANAKVAAFQFNFYGLNNALQFYSDVAANPIVDDVAAVSRLFDEPGLVLCIMRVSNLADMQNVQNLHVIRRADELVLVANQALDISSVRTW
jgi:4-amino-4-deoxy-L-arabinose transferase-like glycosyltransferase